MLTFFPIFSGKKIDPPDDPRYRSPATYDILPFTHRPTSYGAKSASRGEFDRLSENLAVILIGPILASSALSYQYKTTQSPIVSMDSEFLRHSAAFQNVVDDRSTAEKGRN